MAGSTVAAARALTLVGRDDAMAVLDGLLADARLGRSGALVLHGEAGIGKTALLDEASARAHDATVLRARGLESAYALPYATLDELLRPVLGLLARIPPVQARALRGAFALAPPVDAAWRLLRRRSACSRPPRRRGPSSRSSTTPTGATPDRARLWCSRHDGWAPQAWC
ncbi:MAG TPA: ATP-binding protein [Solirubrobacteraceae bacterium]|jgi:hypothetical protein|nr:ATP-binding protein [Solirubrobacteraceae bacterium]